MIAIFTFFIVLTTIGSLYIWLKFIMKKNAVKCPLCGTSWIGDSERIVSATCRCDNCGRTVITS